MVNIHKCKKCNSDIYYLPIKVDGELKGFHAMNLDRSSHGDCIQEGLDSEARYLDGMERAYKLSLEWNNPENYQEGYDFPRRDRYYSGEDLET